jgi:hypothetical protein
MTIEKPHPAGTIFVLRSHGPTSAAIRLGTNSPVNHAGVCLGDGRTVEAEGAGAVYRHERPTGSLVIYGNTLLRRIEAAQPGIGVAMSKAAVALLGRGYNFLDIAAIALWELGIHADMLDRRIERDDKLICSQLVAVAAHNIGVDLVPGRAANYVRPVDLLVTISSDDWGITVNGKAA